MIWIRDKLSLCLLWWCYYSFHWKRFVLMSVGDVPLLRIRNKISLCFLLEVSHLEIFSPISLHPISISTAESIDCGGRQTRCDRRNAHGRFRRDFFKNRKFGKDNFRTMMSLPYNGLYERIMNFADKYTLSPRRQNIILCNILATVKTCTRMRGIWLLIVWLQ